MYYDAIPITRGSYGYYEPQIPKRPTVQDLDFESRFQLSRSQPVFTVLGIARYGNMHVVAVVPGKKAHGHEKTACRYLHLASDRAVIMRDEVPVKPGLQRMSLSDQIAKIQEAAKPKYVEPKVRTCPECGAEYYHGSCSHYSFCPHYVSRTRRSIF